MSRLPDERVITQLYESICQVLAQARGQAYRAVNSSMVRAYWEVGRLIVEHMQQGEERAAYGHRLLAELAARLTQTFGRGFDETNLRKMRQFYLVFSNRDAPRLESEARAEKRDTARLVSPPCLDLRDELSWSHYRALMRVEDEHARTWYMNEAADQGWSTRQLRRQISTLYYERLLGSRDRRPVREEADAKLATVDPEQFIRDPYVLEFLDIPDRPSLRENELEKGLIDSRPLTRPVDAMRSMDFTVPVRLRTADRPRICAE